VCVCVDGITGLEERGDRRRRRREREEGRG
jgi:hypothetical protein